MNGGRRAWPVFLGATLLIYALGCKQVIDVDEPLNIQEGESGILRAPALASPKDGAVITTTDRVTLRWHVVTGARIYSVEVSSDSSFVDIVDSATVDTTFNRTQSLQLGKYYWHARANNSVGRPGYWSEMRVFNRRYQSDGTPL